VIIFAFHADRAAEPWSFGRQNEVLHPRMGN
jgi:hypothetical protein